MATDIGVLALFVLAFGAISDPIKRTVVTPPMIFAVLGLAFGPEFLGVLDLGLQRRGVEILAEATLILILFSDAARIDLPRLRHEYSLPARLLGIGMPLTIVLGTALALSLFPTLSFGEAALLATILAPTDAALGQIVVTSQRIPVRIRQSLNVESGLNDGIALPVVTIFIAVAGTEAEVRSADFWVEFAAKQIGFGVLLGVAIGLVGGYAINRSTEAGWMDGTFRQLSTLAVAVAAFAFADSVDGNGFIAAFTAGAAFGKITPEGRHDIVDFTEDEGQLLTLLTFAIFGASILGPAIDQVTWEIALYALLSLTVVRMLPVAIAMIDAKLQPETILFMGWFGPRGLASILFGLVILEEELAIAQSDQVFLVVTWTVFFSIMLHGLTALPGANAYAARFESMADEHDAMPEAMPVTEMRTRYE